MDTNHIFTTDDIHDLRVQIAQQYNKMTKAEVEREISPPSRRREKGDRGVAQKNQRFGAHKQIA